MEEASPKDSAIGVVTDSLRIGQGYKLIIELSGNFFMGMPSQPCIQLNVLLRRRGMGIAAGTNLNADEL